MHFLLDNLGAVTDWRTGETWSADQIRAQANGMAGELARRGVGRGSKVITWHGGDGRFFADMFAIWQVGACTVALNPNTTATELETIAEFVDPAAIIDRTDTRIPEALANKAVVSDTIQPATTHSPAADSHLDDDALILFTSGTTGTPKGVLHTFRSLLARVALNQAYIPRAQRMRTLCVLPTHFGHGLIGNCLTVLLDGQDLYLAPASNLDVPASLGAIIDQYQINFMSSVPTLWKRVIGEWTRTDQVFNMYGITETANWLSGVSPADQKAADGLIGTMWGGTIAVRNAAGNIAARGEGELVVQSPSLMKGYFQLPEKTEEVMRDGWFHTGDIGRIGDDGMAYLTGRERYVINRGGLKVHPEDVDMLLERHEIVDEACAFAIPHETEGETVGVALALKPGAHFDEAQIRRWCAERLSREKTPVQWFVVDEVPKTDRGKINRDIVAVHCLAGKG
jgi:acyl-CoA synthetase (AMP-forming)/AMP-acid ligase II